jgi:hypothetical protein
MPSAPISQLPHTQWWVFLAIIYREYGQNYRCKRNWGGAQCLVAIAKIVSNETHPQNCKPMIPRHRAHVVGTHIFGGYCTYVHNASSDHHHREELAEVKVKLGWWLIDGCLHPTIIHNNNPNRDFWVNCSRCLLQPSFPFRVASQPAHGVVGMASSWVFDDIPNVSCGLITC